LGSAEEGAILGRASLDGREALYYNHYQSDLPDHSNHLERELKKLDDQSKQRSKVNQLAEYGALLLFFALIALRKIVFAVRHPTHLPQREDL